jgi:uncharacterized protein (DUF983 family)
MIMDLAQAALRCRCPKCGVGKLYRSRCDLTLNGYCANCGLVLSKNDNGDGPAVFLIFILGFALVPMAVLFEVLVSPPLWVHAVLWGVIALGITLGTLKPIKSLVLHIQYRTRPETWQEK